MTCFTMSTVYNSGIWFAVGVLCVILSRYWTKPAEGISKRFQIPIGLSRQLVFDYAGSEDWLEEELKKLRDQANSEGPANSPEPHRIFLKRVKSYLLVE